jgi:uncharacterized protein with ATP-grasp and redox domains
MTHHGDANTGGDGYKIHTIVPSAFPPPLMVSEPGSFAEDTIRSRKPTILADILAHNTYPPDVVRGLESLRDEIASRASVSGLNGPSHDMTFWQRALAPWNDNSWFELPWFLAETYFYRRVLDIVGYKPPGACPILGRQHAGDPFAPQKAQALRDGLIALERHIMQIPQTSQVQDRFRLWLRRSLWGNRADLSNIGTRDDVDADDERRSEHILVDHGQRLWELFAQGRVRYLDVVADNAGAELLSDLGLIDLLLGEELVQRVRLHLKGQPFFVSDAMPSDLEDTLAALKQDTRPALAALGARLADHVAANRICWQTHPFWTTCLHYPQLPDDLRTTLAEANLLLLKGDVNYRRLLSDAHWPPTARLEAITNYMPASFVTLRTLKAEIIAGLAPGQAEALSRRDPNWLISGDWGVIHLVEQEELRPEPPVGGGAS